MQNEFSLLVLFTLGLFSSLHCIGMCGGVIGALSFGLDSKVRENKSRLFFYIAAYNFGRLTSYTVAGMLAGALGMTLLELLGMNIAHTIMRALSALMMIALGLYLGGWFPQLSRLDKLGAKLWKKIQPLSQHFMPVKHPWQAYGFGMVWGWLPCGLVYTALLLAAVGGNASNGGLGMLAFGLGTLPAVMGAGMIAGGLSKWLQKKQIRQTFGVMLICFGILILFIPMDHSLHQQHEQTSSTSHNGMNHL